MKNITIIILTVMLTQLSFTQTMTVHKNDQTTINFQLSQIDSITFSIIPIDGLVAYYPFNGNANDESRNGNNGTVNGATLTTDRFGNNNAAYSFSDNPNNITISSVHQTNILSYSVAGWFQKNSNSINLEGTIFCGNIPCNPPGGLRFSIGTTNQAYWGAEFQSCSSMGLLTENQNYADDTWHFFAVTIDAVPGIISANQLKIYIDNNLVPQSQYSQGDLNNVIAPINNQNLPTIIGNLTTSDNYLQGKLDDIRIYNRALSDTEIQALYHEGGW